MYPRVGDQMPRAQDPVSVCVCVLLIQSPHTALENMLLGSQSRTLPGPDNRDAGGDPRWEGPLKEGCPSSSQLPCGVPSGGPSPGQAPFPHGPVPHRGPSVAGSWWWSCPAQCPGCTGSATPLSPLPGVEAAAELPPASAHVSVGLSWLLQPRSPLCLPALPPSVCQVPTFLSRCWCHHS